MTEHRDEDFIAYCNVCQRWPRFYFGGTGLNDEDVQEFAVQSRWNCSPLPPASVGNPQHISYNDGQHDDPLDVTPANQHRLFSSACEAEPDGCNDNLVTFIIGPSDFPGC